jgi:parallel beta helix pectate lyase-like protein
VKLTRRIAIYVGVLIAVGLGATVVLAETNVPSSEATGGCTLFASPTGSDSASGSVTSPFRTVTKLVGSLSSGQVGCLRGGTYSEDVTVGKSGITLTAYTGEQATLVGRLWIQNGADGVTVTNLKLDGKNAALLPSPTVNGDNDRFIGDEVTNENTEICFVLGSSWGRAQGTLIQGNRIHNCGKLPSDNQDHGIYVADADNTQILDNVIYDNVDRGIQLYPDAQGTVIRRNIIDSNGEGIIFSGAGGTASSNTVVDHNVISNAQIRADVESWYPLGNPVGTNNVVHDNCVVPGAGGGINASNGGFTAYSNLSVSDALFVNASSGDYRLQSTSPCATYLTDSTAPAGLGGEAPVGSTSGGGTSWQPVVGARVKITSTSSADYGKTGEITYVSNDGQRALLLMDDSGVKGVQVSDIGPAQ